MGLTRILEVVISQAAGPGTVGGAPVAPSLAQLQAAIGLHDSLLSDLQLKNGVFVLGQQSESGLGSTAQSDTTLDTYVPATLTLSSSDPGPLPSAAQLRAAMPGGQFTGVANGDFTVFVVLSQAGTTLSFQSITQSRRATLSVGGVSYVQYTVRRYAGTPSGGNLPLAQSYQFVLPASQDVWAAPVGAKALWLVDSSSWMMRYQAGSSVIFPDPYAGAGDLLTTSLSPTSRFTYYLQTTP